MTLPDLAPEAGVFARLKHSVFGRLSLKLLQWGAEQGERFDHCILGEPSNATAIGDTIKIGRRGSLNGTLVVTGKQGHVAYPERADNPVRGLVTLLRALMAEPLDRG